VKGGENTEEEDEASNEHF